MKQTLELDYYKNTHKYLLCETLHKSNYNKPFYMRYVLNGNAESLMKSQ